MGVKQKFFVIEGCDGAGKTYLAQKLGERIRSEGHDCIVTSEPKGTQLGRDLKFLIDQRKLDVYEEMLLFTTARYHHVRRVILPALESGKVVICDRYKASTRVYQGPQNGTTQMLNLGFITPCLSFLLIGDPEKLKKRNKNADKYDKESIQRFKRRQKEYLKIASVDPKRWCVLDSDKNAVNDAMAAINKFLEEV